MHRPAQRQRHRGSGTEAAEQGRASGLGRVEAIFRASKLLFHLVHSLSVLAHGAPSGTRDTAHAAHPLAHSAHGAPSGTRRTRRTLWHTAHTARPALWHAAHPAL